MDAHLKPNALVVMLRWHEMRRSEAAHDVLLRPLADHFTFSTCGVEWGQAPPAEVLTAARGPVIFFQTPPPARLVTQSSAPLTWIPMWDSVAYRSQRWWNRLPRRLRVVAFSEEVALHAERAGLALLRLRYASDPAAFQPAQWEQGRIALYWNRTGAVRVEFLEALCTAMGIDRLLFKNRLDPGVSASQQLQLPRRLGAAQVEEIPQTADRDEYFRLTEAVNILLAPRLLEGIGLTYLEAMARGCVVLAADRPTMNEAIRDRETGVLLRMEATPTWQLQWRRAWHRGLARIGADCGPVERISAEQPWQELAKLDLPAIGARARQAQQNGLTRWQASLTGYARFLMGEA